MSIVKVNEWKLCRNLCTMYYIRHQLQCAFEKKTIFLFILASSMIPKIFSVYPTATYIPVYNVFHLLEFFISLNLYIDIYIYFFFFVVTATLVILKL